MALELNRNLRGGWKVSPHLFRMNTFTIRNNLSFLILFPLLLVTSEPPFPEVLAKINGVPITRQHFEERLAQSRSMNPSLFDSLDYKEKERAIFRVLNAMILRELEYQESVHQKIVVEEEEVEKEFLSLQKRYRTEDDLATALKQFKMTEVKWKEEMRKTIAIRKLEEKISRQIPISNDEIDAYLKTTITEYPSSEISHAQREEARWILQQIRWGKKRKVWLKKLSDKAEIWRWSPP